MMSIQEKEEIIISQSAVRLQDESYEDYKIRRTKNNKDLRKKLKGTMFYASTYYIKQTGRVITIAPPYKKSEHNNTEVTDED